MKNILKKTVVLPVSAGCAFAWHEQPGAFTRLIPPWEFVQVKSADGGIRDGAHVVLQTKIGMLPMRWIALHYGYAPGRRFCDLQKSGPFKEWRHIHQFDSISDSQCLLTDLVTYRLPCGSLGDWLMGGAIERKLDQMFAHRQQTTLFDLKRHSQFLENAGMHIAISGASGLVGSSLVSFLRGGGHRISSLVRTQPGKDEVLWNPETGEFNAESLDDVDAVVHLAGENIATRRWNDTQKKRIRDSRVEGTRLLCDGLSSMNKKPDVLVCASAIGYYGNRGDTLLAEDAASGTGFLADVCSEWEEATQPAISAGIRVVNLRIGVVLSPQGGALEKMLTPFKLGAGGVVGPGSQYWSWISLDDVVGAIHFAMMNESLKGPVNAVAPQAVDNRQFTKTLGRVLKRPTVFPLPTFMARIMFGEMAEDLLLSSTRVDPRCLLEASYEFRHPDLETALRQLLGKNE